MSNHGRILSDYDIWLYGTEEFVSIYSILQVDTSPIEVPGLLRILACEIPGLCNLNTQLEFTFFKLI